MNNQEWVNTGHIILLDGGGAEVFSFWCTRVSYVHLRMHLHIQDRFVGLLLIFWLVIFDGIIARPIQVLQGEYSSCRWRGTFLIYDVFDS